MLGYWFPRAARRKPSSLNPKTPVIIWPRNYAQVRNKVWGSKSIHRFAPTKLKRVHFGRGSEEHPICFMSLKESIRSCKEAHPSVSLPLSCPDVFLLPSLIYSFTISGSLPCKCYSSPRLLTFQAPNKIKIRVCQLQEPSPSQLKHHKIRNE